MKSESPTESATFTKSQELADRAARVIPGSSQTFSKARTQYPEGASPLFLERGKGSHVWDVDGHEYIDYAMALCPAVLGYNHPKVQEAVSKQLADGPLFSLPHPLEVLAAEQLTEIIPCAEMVRFAKNGSDATSGAVRVARAYTNRELIACCGYHGWNDWYIGTTTRAGGVPKGVREQTKTFRYNDIANLETLLKSHPGQFAAVIMEPMGLDLPQEGYLQKVIDLAHQHGALVIFDEIVTGFRWSLGGAQEYFNVTPDMACFGKAMSNGYPLSCVVGKREYMKVFDEIFFSFTYGGETLSLAAHMATVAVMKKEPVFEQIWKQGAKLLNGFNKISSDAGLLGLVKAHGIGARHVLEFLDKDKEPNWEAKSLFQQEVIKCGVLYGPGNNISYAHTDQDILKTLDAYASAFKVLKPAYDNGDFKRYLVGKTVIPVFRKA